MWWNQRVLGVLLPTIINSDLRSSLPHMSSSRPIASLNLGHRIILSSHFVFLIFSFTPLFSLSSLLIILITLNSSTSSLPIYLLPLTMVCFSHALDLGRFPFCLKIFKNISNFALIELLLTSLHYTWDLIGPLWIYFLRALMWSIMNLILAH